jgi:hypothetical protein
MTIPTPVPGDALGGDSDGPVRNVTNVNGLAFDTDAPAKVKTTKDTKTRKVFTALPPHLCSKFLKGGCLNTTVSKTRKEI